MTRGSGWAAPSTAIRRGLWLLPLGAIVPVVIFTIWLAIPSDLDTDPRAAAAAAAGPLGLVTGGVYLLALVALLFGVQALYGWLAPGPARTWALAGLAFGVTSLGLLLAAFGAFILGGAIVAATYLSGAPGSLEALRQLSGGGFGPPVLAAFVAGALLGVAYGLANGVALWRAGLPRWVPVTFGLGFALFALSAPIVSHLGGLLLAIAGGWIARAAGRPAA